MIIDAISYYISEVRRRTNRTIIYWSCILFRVAPIWHTNYDEALEEAEAQNKIVLAYFKIRGCYPCDGLKRVVFSSPRFKCWAHAVVLLEVDLTGDLTTQPEWLVEQNRELEERYSIVSYPVVIGLNADGTEHGRVAGWAEWMTPTRWISLFISAARLDVTTE
jgi:thioredoxin-related protein